MNITRHIITILLLAVIALPMGAVLVEVDTAMNAELKPLHHIGADLRSGWIVPNKSFFKGNNQKEQKLDKTVSAYVKYAFNYAPNSVQGRMFPNTYQGIGVGYHNFFDNEEIGNPVSVYVLQGSRIANLSNTLSLDYEWNFGASFGWKKYDEETNVYNTVVGSKVNAYINLGIMLNWRFAHDWSLSAGVDVSHFSNGNTSSPNAGVNTIGARVGVMHTFSAKNALQTENLLPRLNIKPHFSYDLVLYGAVRKRGIITEDEKFMVPSSFAVAGLNFSPMYNFGNIFCAGASLDIQYDESANIKYHVASPDGTTSGEDTKFYRPPFRESFAAGVSLRAEVVMPIFSVNIGIGHNVVYKGSDNGGFYQIVALKAYMCKNVYLHIGYRLIDFHDPSNLMLGIGYRFHNKR